MTVLQPFTIRETDRRTDRQPGSVDGDVITDHPRLQINGSPTI